GSTAGDPALWQGYPCRAAAVSAGNRVEGYSPRGAAPAVAGASWAVGGPPLARIPASPDPDRHNPGQPINRTRTNQMTQIQGYFHPRSETERELFAQQQRDQQ